MSQILCGDRAVAVAIEEVEDRSADALVTRHRRAVQHHRKKGRVANACWRCDRGEAPVWAGKPRLRRVQAPVAEELAQVRGEHPPVAGLVEAEKGGPSALAFRPRLVRQLRNGCCRDAAQAARRMEMGAAPVHLLRIEAVLRRSFRCRISDARQEGVPQRCLRCDSGCWVEVQQPCRKVDSKGRGLHRLQVFLHVAFQEAAVPSLPETNVVVGRKGIAAGEEDVEDNSERPHVVAVRCRVPTEHLRGHVQQRPGRPSISTISEYRGSGRNLNGITEVYEHQGITSACARTVSEQEVLGLYVAVNHGAAVAMERGANHLGHEPSGLQLRHAPGPLEKSAAELLSTAEFCDEPEVAARLEVLDKSTHVRVVHEPHGLDLARRCQGVWRSLLVNALHGPLDARSLVHGAMHLAEGAFAQLRLLTDGVCLLDGEVGVLSHKAPRHDVQQGVLSGALVLDTELLHCILVRDRKVLLASNRETEQDREAYAH
mmetsp:Transcript_70132/g.157488  ORF Transcript_70132/g.157488 Transcript_70132/m.157488 type:complete len:486 (-) Transcript_70132:319-1776(-)